MQKSTNTSVNFIYTVVSDLDRKYGLWVNTVGFQQIEKGLRYPPVTNHPTPYIFNTLKGRILHEYQLLYITHGEGYFESDSSKKMKIEKGTLILLFPGQWHTYCPLPNIGWNEYCIGFEGSFIDQIVKASFFSAENQVIKVGFHENLVNLFSRAIEIAKEDRIASQQYLAGILLHILGKVLSITKNDLFANDEAKQKIERAKIIMNENVYNNIEPEQIADSLNISYSWFRKIFKVYTGYAPAQYIQELKINKAKLLLTETNQTVKEIAYQLNYNSPEHFFSIFKRKTKLTPTDYRNLSEKRD